MAPTMEYTYWVLAHRTAEGEWEDLDGTFDSLAMATQNWSVAANSEDVYRNLTILEVTVTKRTIVP